MTTNEYIAKLIKFHKEKYTLEPSLEWVYDKVSKKISMTKEELQPILYRQLLEFKTRENREAKRKERAELIDFVQANFKELLELFKKKGGVVKNKLLSSSIKFSWITSLRYVLLLVGSGSVYMSVYYSNKWLLDFLSPNRALLLSSIMVIFAVSAFELIVLFKKEKQYILVILFTFLWCVVTIFSMTSTIAGQYNSRMSFINKTYKEKSKESTQLIQYKEYEEQRKEYKETITMLRKDSLYYQGLLSQFNSAEDIQKNINKYNSLSWSYRRTQNELKSIIAKLEKLRKNSRGVSLIEKVPPDFYLWISSMFGWKPDLIQFWMSIFPAIFIDLVAPISIAVFMFVKK